MIAMQLEFFVVCGLCIFGAGGCIGALIVLGVMEKRILKLEKGYEEIEAEYTEFVKTRELIDTIDDVPEYLRGKYHIPVTQSEEFE